MQSVDNETFLFEKMDKFFSFDPVLLEMERVRHEQEEASLRLLSLMCSLGNEYVMNWLKSSQDDATKNTKTWMHPRV